LYDRERNEREGKLTMVSAMISAHASSRDKFSEQECIVRYTPYMACCTQLTVVIVTEQLGCD
jgi:hypothetical protein